MGIKVQGLYRVSLAAQCPQRTEDKRDKAQCDHAFLSRSRTMAIEIESRSSQARKRRARPKADGLLDDELERNSDQENDRAKAREFRPTCAPTKIACHPGPEQARRRQLGGGESRGNGSMLNRPTLCLGTVLGRACDLGARD